MCKSRLVILFSFFSAGHAQSMQSAVDDALTVPPISVVKNMVLTGTNVLLGS